MNEDRIEALMNEVLADMANPPARNQWLDELKRSTTMTATTVARSNVLVFGSVQTSGLSKRAWTTAAALNIAAALLLFLFVQSAKLVTAPKVEQLAVLSVPPPAPPPLAPKLNTAGGGGGNPGAAPVSRGNPPKFAPQLEPVKQPQIQAKLEVPPTVDVQPDLKMARVDTLNLGIPNSPAVGVSLGNGRGGGIGSGSGNGVGAGSGGNTGGGIRRIGGGVSAPVVLFKPEPEFSEEARKAKVSGNVLVYLQIDADGHPQHVRVLRGIGLGLDEKALEAVSHYRFRPAMENGHPVAVEMNVEVNFQIF